jgi:dimethylargininase
MPDAVFVEDAAIVLDELAIITRPGVESRRAETASVARTLREYRPLASIEPPGTLEGGDALWVGRTLYVGLSGRSNDSGIRQLRALISPCGYRVEPVEVRSCLHLKSGVTQVAPDTLLINPEWVDKGHFGDVSVVEVDPEEPHGGNALLIGTTVIYPGSFPRTRKRLENRGIAVMTVDVSELQKAEGAVTCSSLVFQKQPVAA